jgi:hypothetical protein
MRFNGLCLLAIFAFQTALAQSSATGSVIGHVTCADTHTPCRFGSVTIESAPPAKYTGSLTPKQPPHSYSAPTDIEGAYQINGVVPGDYYVLARIAGYVSPYDLAANEFRDNPSFESQAFEVALTRITVSPNQSTTANLMLTRGASLAGIIRYDDGGPGINVKVYFYRRDGSGQWKAFSDTGGNGNLAALGFDPETDDRGRFYEPGLPPGSYIIEACLPSHIALPEKILKNGSINVSMGIGDALCVFTGDKFRMRNAIPIELHEGEYRSDIEINIPTTGMHSVHGTVTTKPDEQSITAGDVRLIDPDNKTELRRALIQQDGSFNFNYIPNGSYLVEIEARSGKDNSKLPYEAFTAPLLVESDLSNLTYSLTRKH